MERLKPKNDAYRKARGGRSRFLDLFCESCGAFLALYQKDGPGPLKRMYVDRIVAPKMSGRAKQLTCASCKKVIGTLCMYEKENRPAYRLYQDAVVKRISKGLLPT